MTMDLDSAPEVGVVEIRGPRLAQEVALGFGRSSMRPPLRGARRPSGSDRR
jgi:hypothetical protein